MNKVNSLNIPAYQRKKELEKKAKKSEKKSKTYKPRKKLQARTRYTESYAEIPVIENNLIEEDIFNENIKNTSATGLREMKICGHCEGYFEKINVAIIKVTSPIRKGDILIFEKEGGLFEQTLNSMQIDRKDVSLARSGSDIGVKTELNPIVGSNVYKVI